MATVDVDGSNFTLVLAEVQRYLTPLPSARGFLYISLRPAPAAADMNLIRPVTVPYLSSYEVRLSGIYVFDVEWLNRPRSFLVPFRLPMIALNGRVVSVRVQSRDKESAVEEKRYEQDSTRRSAGGRHRFRRFGRELDRL